MTKDDIHLLFAYDRWANNRLLECVSTLNDEQFTRDLRGAFRSLRDTFVHLIASEWGWITYWKEPSPTASLLNDLWDRNDQVFAPETFPNFASVLQAWKKVEEEQVQFVNHLTEESMARMLPVGSAQLTLVQLMQHLANHSTYHRGQIALMMRQLDAVPSSTDFDSFLTSTAAK